MRLDLFFFSKKHDMATKSTWRFIFKKKPSTYYHDLLNVYYILNNMLLNRVN